MNKQGEHNSFCFRCAVPTTGSHEAIQQSQNEQPSLLQNPWPLLAANPDIYTVRANPLIRSVYFPTHLGETDREIKRILREKRKEQLTEENIGIFKNAFILWHEEAHFQYMDWTPAKDLARIYLALSYMCIAIMLSFQAESESEWEVILDHWKSLESYGQNLNQIEESIGFVEEVFANAWTIQIMEGYMRQGDLWEGYKEQLIEIKKQIEIEEEYHQLGFRKAYKDIQPLVYLSIINQSLRPYIIALLEPIEEWGGDSHGLAMDAYENLKKMLEQPFIKSFKTYLKRLNTSNSTGGTKSKPSLYKHSDEFREYLIKFSNEQWGRWERSLALQISQAWEVEKEWAALPHSMRTNAFRRWLNPPFLKLLWKISHGDLPAQGTYYDAQMYAAATRRRTMDFRSTHGKEPNIYAWLGLLTNSEGQQFIGINVHEN